MEVAPGVEEWPLLLVGRQPIQLHSLVSCPEYNGCLGLLLNPANDFTACCNVEVLVNGSGKTEKMMVMPANTCLQAVGLV